MLTFRALSLHQSESSDEGLAFETCEHSNLFTVVNLYPKAFSELSGSPIHQRGIKLTKSISPKYTLIV